MGRGPADGLPFIGIGWVEATGDDEDSRRLRTGCLRGSVSVTSRVSVGIPSYQEGMIKCITVPNWLSSRVFCVQ